MEGWKLRRIPASLIRGGFRQGQGQRMRQQDWPRAAGLASFSVIAVGFAAFLLSAGDQRHYVEAAAILLLATGQFAVMIFGWIRMSQVIERNEPIA